MILINDEKQAKMYKENIAPNLEAGNMLNHNRPTIQVIRRLAKDMTILANIAEPKPATEQPGISQTGGGFCAQGRLH